MYPPRVKDALFGPYKKKHQKPGTGQEKSLLGNQSFYA